MPFYEFRCADCGGTTTHFSRRVDTGLRVPCGHCSSEDTARIMSAFGRTYSRADIIGRYGDPSTDRDGGDFRDPRQVGGWVEREFARHGLDLPGETRQMIDAAREGVLPSMDGE